MTNLSDETIKKRAVELCEKDGLDPYKFTGIRVGGIGTDFMDLMLNPSEELVQWEFYRLKAKAELEGNDER